jgi:hypothetical protein
MKVKIIYLAGEGRSGTTLLEKLLAEQNNIFAGGELRYIWERSIKDDQLCSCGKRFSECEVWQRIISDIRENINVDLFINTYNKIGRMRHYPFFKLLKKCNNKDFDIISNIYYKLYKSILKNTNSTYVIDSSKHPVFAHILSTNPNIELYVIHLIRDPRAVAYSSMKKRIRPEIKDRVEYMPIYPSYISATAWKFVNIVSEQLNKESKKYMRLKYEDMFKDIKATINKIGNFLELESINFDFIKSNNIVKLHSNHTTSGNPMRFKSGNIKLRIDDEWKENLSLKDKKIVEFICKKEMEKYGYL